MKRIVIICLFICILIAGCGQVTMTAPYRAQTELTAIRLTELNNRCQNGDDQACKEGLKAATDFVNLIVDAMNGKESN